MASNGPHAEITLTAKNNTAAGVKSAEQSILGSVTKMGTAFKALFATAAAATIGKFFVAAVDEATKADKAFAKLGVSLRNVGVNAETARPLIDRTIKSLSLLTGKDGEDISDALSNLVTLTGDYEGSLRALPTVLDIASARQIDLSAASDIMAKAMNGNTGALKRLGIEIQAGLNPIDALRAKFGGFAEAEGKTFAGQLGRIHEAWNNVLEAVGRAIINNDKFASGGNVVIDMLVKLEDWISRNEEAISGFVSSAVTGIEKVTGAVGRLLHFTSNLPPVKFARWVWGKVLGIGGDDIPVDAGSGARHPGTKTQELQTSATNVPTRETPEEKAARLARERDQKRQEQELVDKTLRNTKDDQGTGKSSSTPTGIRGGVAQFDPATELENTTTALDLHSEAISNALDKIDSFRGAWLDTFEAIGSGENVFASIAKSAKKAIADLARTKAQNEFAEGTAALAQGLFGGGPPALASAAEHFLAAGLFAAIAGAAGGSGRGGRGGPGSGGLSHNGLSDTGNDLSGNRNAATIILQGNKLWDMNDPAQIEAFTKALSDVSGRRVIVENR